MPRIEVFHGDITTLAVDAIVNAANEALLPGGGVCGAIHHAAGPQLAKACAPLAPCPTGKAALTPGFLLPARFVIHAVGPRWQGGKAGEAELLAGAYRSALALCLERGLASVAFPALSTGIYGYPPAEATRIAVATVGDWLKREQLPRRVVFAAFDAETEGLYRTALGG